MSVCGLSNTTKCRTSGWPAKRVNQQDCPGFCPVIPQSERKLTRSTNQLYLPWVFLDLNWGDLVNQGQLI